MLIKLAKPVIEAGGKAFWKLLAKKAAETAITTVITSTTTVLVRKIISDKGTSFKEKFDTLEQLKKSGDITEGEYQLARKSLFETYAKHK